MGLPSAALLAVALVATASFHGACAFEIKEHKITSLMAASYTPMKNDGMELDLDRIPAYAAFLAKLNITNVMPAGTNGESLSMSVPERKQLAEAWAKAGPANGLHIYMHIGSESLVEAMDLARHAASLEGISGIICMTPLYFKPTVETLHDFLAKVAGAAPEMPFWFYHFPDDTGILKGQAHSLLEHVEQTGKIPNFMGIKYTDYDLMDFSLCMQVAKGKYNMLYGRDEQALAALDLGADAAVSSTVQYAPSLRQAIYLWSMGDKLGAKTAQETNARLCSLFGAYGAAAKNVQKGIMKMVCMDVGPSRLPFADLDGGEYSALNTLLLKNGFIDTANCSQLVV